MRWRWPTPLPTISELLDPISIVMGLTRRTLMRQSFEYIFFGEGETGLLVYSILVRYWEATNRFTGQPVILLVSESAYAIANVQFGVSQITDVGCAWRILLHLTFLREEAGDTYRSRASGPSPFERKPSANSIPAGGSAAADTIRIGTCGFICFHLRSDFRSALVGQEMVGDDQIDRILPEEFQAFFARRGCQNLIARTAEQQLADPQRHFCVIDTQN